MLLYIMSFWLNNPSILFDKDHIFDLWPLPEMEFTEKMNAISRVVILMTVLGLFFTHSLKILVSGIVTLGVICYLNSIKGNKKEGMKNLKIDDLIKSNFESPNNTNPMMNVMLPDIGDNPKKPAAPSFYPIVEDEINSVTKENILKQFNNDKNIEDKLFTDLGNNMQFEQSMRSFYTMPNTEVPADQKAFAEFCYGSMKSCKENNLDCTVDSSAADNYAHF